MTRRTSRKLRSNRRRSSLRRNSTTMAGKPVGPGTNGWTRFGGLYRSGDYAFDGSFSDSPGSVFVVSGNTFGAPIGRAKDIDGANKIVNKHHRTSRKLRSNRRRSSLRRNSSIDGSAARAAAQLRAAAKSVKAAIAELADACSRVSEFPYVVEDLHGRRGGTGDFSLYSFILDGEDAEEDALAIADRLVHRRPRGSLGSRALAARRTSRKRNEERTRTPWP